MELYIIRHGETIDNLMNICQGQTEGELNQKGKDQAYEASRKLEEIEFDAVYTSDLKRARNTSEIIFGNRKGLKINEDNRLRERYLGDYQGKVFPDSFDYNARYIDGAESLDDMFGRVNSLLDEVKDKYRNKSVAFISHGITIKVLIASINNKNDIEGLKTPDNCSISKFTL